MLLEQSRESRITRKVHADNIHQQEIKYYYCQITMMFLGEKEISLEC